MKVLILMDALINAGTEKSMLAILPHFSKELEVEVIYFFPHHDLRNKYEQAGIQVTYLKTPKRGWLFALPRLVKLIRLKKPALMVSMIYRANILSRLSSWITRVPLIGTFVSDSYSTERKKAFTTKRKIGAWFYYWIDRLTSFIPVHFIANSESIRVSNAIALKIPESKISVVYRGRDFNAMPQWKPRNRPDFRFIYLGRLIESKGLKELLQAFRTLSNFHQHTFLDIVGKGKFRPELERLCYKYNIQDRVIFHGEMEDGWTLFSDSDCFVLPSWVEGFSGSLLEAMIAGIPTLASDISMNKEITDNGTLVYLFQVGEYQDLAQKMARIIENYEEAIRRGEAARRNAFDAYHIVTISKKYESVLLQFATR